MTFTATCDFAGIGAKGLVAVLAKAGVELQMMLKIEGWGSDPELAMPVTLKPLVAGVLSYSLSQSLPVNRLTEGLYEVKAAATLTGVGSTFGIAGYNSIPTLQIIGAAPTP